MHPEKYDFFHNLFVIVKVVTIVGIAYGIGAAIHHVALRIFGKK